ncbi:hypothetical protein TWF106_004549 [Orbilia oligospora]|uniref:Uncharacterized protein n=1 Tax=Orbilia oligospora TaxID=2813651 RepID=A0A7C8Q678_ORBOL|nr:hypothetical protein TWF106_004549 [Orbilia oligospora]
MAFVLAPHVKAPLRLLPEDEFERISREQQLLPVVDEYKAKISSLGPLYTQDRRTNYMQCPILELKNEPVLCEGTWHVQSTAPERLNPYDTNLVGRGGRMGIAPVSLSPTVHVHDINEIKGPKSEDQTTGKNPQYGTAIFPIAYLTSQEEKIASELNKLD